ncbi:MAG: hypothetical protein HY822_04520 [Acidobacteria bacterium]|nr:hypothetical protein [Acidobacteriota bacterium]
MALSNRRAPDFERILAEGVRKAGWRVQRSRRWAEAAPDLIAEVEDRLYAFELKAASEGRRDRLIPLLSQAILQSQTIARRFLKPVVAVAVVAAEHVPAVVAEQILEFGRRHAPEAGVGVIDAGGFRRFAGHGLEVLNSKPVRRLRDPAAAPKRLPHLFSDLNQWMLKVLLGQSISESLISVPRGRFRNASQLAEAADVSLMSAFRFVSQLGNEGFLGEEAGAIRVVRVEELLERWVSANRRPAHEIPARWLIKRDVRQLYADIARHGTERCAASQRKVKSRGGRAAKANARCCIGLFAAADLLGCGFVRGVLPHLYLERFDEGLLRQLGLTAAGSDGHADIFVRVPAHREAVFRAAVMRDSLPVSDAIQVWLDVSVHPARGREQAAEIWRKALAPLLGTK